MTATYRLDDLTRFFDTFHAAHPQHQFVRLQDGYYYGLQQPNHINISVFPGRVLVTYYGRSSYRLHGYSTEAQLDRMLGHMLRTMPPRCPPGPWY